jgi:hypothetical protein
MHHVWYSPTHIDTDISGLSLTCIAHVRIPLLLYRQGPLKKILVIWEDRDILTTATIKELQARLALTKPPYDIGTCAIVIPCCRTNAVALSVCRMCSCDESKGLSCGFSSQTAISSFATVTLPSL